MNESRHLIIITGPTAVGKTELSIQVAMSLKTEIISADSRQLYQELKIGVARPTVDELSQVPHHFIGSHSIHEKFTVADYERASAQKISELFADHQYIVCTGGTGLYLKAITHGLDVIPDIDVEITLRLQKILVTEGIETLQKMLQQVDPRFYEKVDTSNTRRLIRALEVYQGTGQCFSEWRTEYKKELPFNVHYIVLDRPRVQLYDRINKRVDMMMEEGLLEEVKALLPYRNLRSLQTVGYSELFSYLEGESSLDEAIVKIKQHTRNYAKRQLTWFRKVDNAQWLSAENTELKEILRLIENT